MTTLRWFVQASALVVALITGCASEPSDLRGFSTVITQAGKRFFIRGDVTIYRPDCGVGETICDWVMTMYPDDVPAEFQKPFYMAIGVVRMPFRNGGPVPGMYALNDDALPFNLLQVTSGPPTRLWLSASGTLTIIHSDSGRLAATFRGQMRDPGLNHLPDLVLDGAFDVAPYSP